MADTQQQRPDWPRTVDEAVDHLIERLSERDKQAIRDAESTTAFHFSLGMWIRNAFGLWGGNRALLASCSARRDADLEGADNVTYLTIDPDSASGVILDALRQRLRQESGM